MCTSQAAVVSASGGASDPGWDIQQSTLPFIFEFNKQMSLKKALVDVKKPQKMTSKLFQPRTADMNSGFLKFDDTKGTISKILKFITLKQVFMMVIFIIKFAKKKWMT